MGDVWGGFILDSIAPLNKGTVHGSEGYSEMDEKKMEGKSKFLSNFYKGQKPNYWQFKNQCIFKLNSLFKIYLTIRNDINDEF